MRYLILLLLFFASMTVLAQSAAVDARNAEINRLEKTMARVSQEAQSTYQEFLMTQELRRNEMQVSPDTIPLNLTGKSIPIPSYDDLIRRRAERDERMEKYNADLDRLYTRYKELESEKEALFEKIKSLEQKPVVEE